jgi:enoyl-CoA hydratase
LPFVLVDKPRPNVTLITLNRPERMNAMAFDVMVPFREALEEVGRDNGTRVVVITGAGRGFCSGADLENPGAIPGIDGLTLPTIALRSMELLDDVVRAMRRVHQPVIAAVNGPAIGGGAYLATACDIVVAVDSAWFQMREIHAGNHAGGHALFTVGRARSLEMNLLGRRISAAKALDWGLINEVVPADRFADAVDAVVAEIAALPPLAVRYTKSATNLLLDSAGFSAHLDAIAPMQRYLSLSPDGREAKAAFLEKRAPHFTGELPKPG